MRDSGAGPREPYPQPAPAAIRVPVDDDAAAAIRRGRPWVYREAVLGPARGAAGSVAEVTDRHGAFLARGLFDPGTSIAVRVLTRRREERFGAALVQRRLEQALALRRRFLDLSAVTAWRLCNGEGDGLPGLVVDVYASYAVVELSTEAWAPYRKMLSTSLVEVFRPRGIVEKSRLGARGRRDVVLHLHGEEPPEELTVEEHGARFLVTLRGTTKSGLFLDQRETRRTLRHLARGGEVLNGFCYTGSLSVACAVGGARRVTSLDLSAPALDRARRNFELNDLDPSAHQWIQGDLFEELPELVRKRKRFDLVILDPPAFATSRKRVFQAERDWAELAGLGLRALRPGGTLVASSPMAALPAASLERALGEGALRAKASVRVADARSQPADHPVAPACPERRYLKVFFLVRD